ncbi:MAG: GNAT family N-acetyltransferase [Bacteroidetes bacterium]|nr:GNAT family N-acetyltransferase [Bacteroidota bacterium]
MEIVYSIRDYTPSDYPELIAVWEKIGLGAAHRGDVPEVIDRTLKMGGRLLLLINKSNNEIMGTSWLTIDGRRTYLHHFGIAEKYQGMGLSKPLLEASLAIVKAIGLQVKLEVHQSNLKAANLYKKYGFTYLGDYDVYIIRDLLSVIL